jgi:Leucine-rich repeat (LRR) protein
LPTEAEWEFAARAGTTTAYSWGDSPSAYPDYAAINGSAQTVGGRKPNAWGLYDMAGNVAEYCSELYVENYPDGLAVDPKGSPIPPRVPSGTTLQLVVRGGDYRSAVGQVRSAARGQVSTNMSSFSLGMRVACDVIGAIPAGAVLHDPPTFRPASTAIASTSPGLFGGPVPPPSTPASAPRAVPAISGVPDPNNPEINRALAEWVIARGGNVQIRGQRGSTITGRLDTLNGYAPYQVREVTFYSRNQALTTAEIQFIAAHRWLSMLTLSDQTLAPEAVQAVAGMPALTSLTLSRSGIGDADLQLIGRLTALNTLNLDGCPITDAGVRHLAGLSQLRSLHLERTQVGDAGLATLASHPSVSSLYLDRCPVTDAGARALAGMTRLSFLKLDETKITDAGMADIGRLTNLSYLSLEDCPVGDAGVRQLNGLARVSTLRLDRTKVSDAGLAAFSSMAGLTSLYLNACPINGTGFVQLRAPRLSTLYVEDTQISDGALAALQLPECRTLSLRRCRVSDNAMVHLAKLRSLRYVYASQTQITSSGGDRLRLSLPDVKVYP